MGGAGIRSRFPDNVAERRRGHRAGGQNDRGFRTGLSPFQTVKGSIRKISIPTLNHFKRLAAGLETRADLRAPLSMRSLTVAALDGRGDEGASARESAPVTDPGAIFRLTRHPPGARGVS